MSAVRHALLLYEDDAALVEHAAPFLDEGLAAGEAVVCVVDDRKLPLVRDAVGRRADRAAWIDVAGHYTRPEAALADYDATVRDFVRRGAPRVRLFGELPALGSGPECDAWIAYDAILNRAFDHYPVSILCGYDARVVPERVLDAARTTHPHLHGEGPNEAFHDPAEVVREHTPDPRPLPGLRTMPVEAGARAFRRALVAEMVAADVAADAIERMVLAANEVLVNARRYAGDGAEVRVGRVADGFVCEVADHGPGFDDPLAGHVPPDGNSGHGAGLWIARQSTARLEIIHADDGLTVRLWA